jgi:hypothetical protein
VCVHETLFRCISICQRSRYDCGGVEYEDSQDDQPAGTEKCHDEFVVRIDSDEAEEEEAGDSWHDKNIGCAYKSCNHFASVDVCLCIAKLQVIHVENDAQNKHL